MRIQIGILAALACAAPAFAVAVPSGTVSSVGLFNPTVDLSTDPSTYSAMNGATFEISGTGGFSGVASTFGTLNGVLSFSSTAGTTISEPLSNFFVFSDANNGTYNFNVNTVTTRTFADSPGVSSSGTLYLLGDVLDNHLGYSSTAASLTIQFNSTGGSAYSSALTLAVPPDGSVPEPASWALMVVGFGATGFAMRRQRRTAVTFS